MYKVSSKDPCIRTPRAKRLGNVLAFCCCHFRNKNTITMDDTGVAKTSHSSSTANVLKKKSSAQVVY